MKYSLVVFSLLLLATSAQAEIAFLRRETIKNCVNTSGEKVVITRKHYSDGDLSVLVNGVYDSSFNNNDPDFRPITSDTLTDGYGEILYTQCTLVSDRKFDEGRDND